MVGGGGGGGGGEERGDANMEEECLTHGAGSG